MNISNHFKIYFDTTLNVPEVNISFNGGETITLMNHEVTEVDLEPGRYTLRAVYNIPFSSTQMEFDREMEAVIEAGFDYEAKICIVLKNFNFLKVYGKRNPDSCC